MTDNPRIAELRRRVDKDPTSIAFAQLAEEYRRIGDYKEAVKTCRDGLARHPGYVSAQVTLGRALVELEEYADARRELEAVLKIAPDNLAAIRALAEIQERQGHIVAQVDEPAVAPVEVETSDAPPMPDFSDWTLDADPAVDLPAPAFAEPPLETKQEDPVLEALEHWLTAIVADRSR